MIHRDEFSFFVSFHCALDINTNSCVPLFSWPAMSLLP